MREPKWIQNLKWNATEFGELLGSKMGSPPVNLEPTDQEVFEYFQGYVEEAYAMLEQSEAHVARLQTLLGHLDASDPNCPQRPILERAVSVAMAMVGNEEKYIEGLERRIESLLSVNGYQSRPWILPHEQPEATEE